MFSKSSLHFYCLSYAAIKPRIHRESPHDAVEELKAINLVYPSILLSKSANIDNNHQPLNEVINSPG